MAKDKSPLSVEERFFINLDEEQLVHEVEIGGYSFTIGVPSLVEEAQLTLTSLKLASKLLATPAFKEAVEQMRYPSLSVPKNEGESVELQEVPIDLQNLSHVSYALQNLPNNLLSLLSTVSYLNVLVKEITYRGQKLAVRKEGKDILIDSFVDFFLYIRHKGFTLTMVEDLLAKALDWLKVVEIEPIEVKNS